MKNKLRRIIFCISICSVICFHCGCKQKVPETVIVDNNDGLLNVEKINDVLEEKGYPYRLEESANIDLNSLTDQSHQERYQFEYDVLSHCDIAFSSVKSYTKEFAKNGMLSPLSEDLLNLLPDDMYPKVCDNYYMFPSDFYMFPYKTGHPDTYYAIVKNEIAEKYNLKTYEDLESYMLKHTDYTVGNDSRQFFYMIDKEEFEGISWYYGVHWNDQTEEFYNPYLNEDNHFKLIEHIQNNVQIIHGNDYEGADIIFDQELRDGYTGIAYQPSVISEYTKVFMIFSSDCNPYAQQFVYDLYHDKDLTLASYSSKEVGILFGNLELLDTNELEEIYGISEFTYSGFVEALANKKSKLFNMDITMSDAVTMDRLFELMDHGQLYSIAGISNVAQVKDVVDTQPDYQEDMVSKLNALYQSQCR